MKNSCSKFLYTGDTSCLYSPYLLIPAYKSLDSVREHLRKNLTIQDACELLYKRNACLHSPYFLTPTYTSVDSFREYLRNNLTAQDVYKLLYTRNAFLHSPYFLTPTYTSVDSFREYLREYLRKNLTIQEVCELLMYPKNVNLKDSFYKVYFAYNRYVFSEFIREVYDKRYPEYKIPRQWRKNHKNIIQSESKLLGKLWELIRLLSKYFYVFPLPLIFFKIVEERDLVLFHSRPKKRNEKSTIRDLKKRIQRQNRFLTNYDTQKGSKNKLESNILNLPSDDSTEVIPFSKEKSPSTVSFLEICHIEADKNDFFRSRYFDFVKCRKSLTRMIFDSHPNLYKEYSKKKIEYRGRKY